MKKHLIIAGIICAASIPPAYAVTKCVRLSSSTTCVRPYGSTGQSNWSALCSGEDIEIQGVAFCGSQEGGSMGTTSETVTISSTSDNNKHCWCKMVSPAVSSWVFSYSFTSAGLCASNCARSCGANARSYAAFRSGLFSGLSD